MTVDFVARAQLTVDICAFCLSVHTLEVVVVVVVAAAAAVVVVVDVVVVVVVVDCECNQWHMTYEICHVRSCS